MTITRVGSIRNRGKVVIINQKLDVGFFNKSKLTFICFGESKTSSYKYEVSFSKKEILDVCNKIK